MRNRHLSRTEQMEMLLLALQVDPTLGAQREFLVAIEQVLALPKDHDPPANMPAGARARQRGGHDDGGGVQD